MSRAAATSTYRVDFREKPAQRPTTAAQGRVPRVARRLALAHRIEALVRAGDLRDYADAARRLGLTRARVTQLMNLLLLAPAIQEEILDLPLVTEGRDPISERQLRPITAEPMWQRQLEMWRALCHTSARPR